MKKVYEQEHDTSDKFENDSKIFTSLNRRLTIRAGTANMTQISQKEQWAVLKLQKQIRKWLFNARWRLHSQLPGHIRTMGN